MTQAKPATKTKIVTYVTITKEVDGAPDSATVEGAFAGARKVREAVKAEGSTIETHVTVGTQKFEVK